MYNGYELTWWYNTQQKRCESTFIALTNVFDYVTWLCLRSVLFLLFAVCLDDGCFFFPFPIHEIFWILFVILRGSIGFQLFFLILPGNDDEGCPLTTQDNTMGCPRFRGSFRPPRWYITWLKNLWHFAPILPDSAGLCICFLTLSGNDVCWVIQWLQRLSFTIFLVILMCLLVPGKYLC